MPSRRYMVVAPPLTGHINRLVPLASGLRDRGAEVVWVGVERMLRRVLNASWRIVDVGGEFGRYEAVHQEARRLRGIRRFKKLAQDVRPALAKAMVTGVEAAATSFSPHALVIDHHALAGAIVAERHGIPWVTSTTVQGATEPFPLAPEIRAWRDANMSAIAHAHGVDRPIDVSPWVNVATVLPGVRPVPPRSGTFRYIHPTVLRKRPPVSFPWERVSTSNGPILFVSFGTVNTDLPMQLLGTAIDMARDWNGLVIAAAPEELRAGAPANVIVQRYVPQLDLLPHVDAVVSHGGFNTVSESLAHGIPLALAPIADDQPLNADAVVRAGAGIRLTFRRTEVAALRSAVEALLTDSSYRRAAEGFQQVLAGSDGSRRGAMLIEEALGF
ncbi:MAG: nucleotide disphospho-sugar-binding domain-containing protein [Bacteroidota bacterium]